MATNQRADNARKMAERIAAFSRRCNSDGYTDTGDAWELLRDAANALRASAGEKPFSDRVWDAEYDADRDLHQ